MDDPTSSTGGILPLLNFASGGSTYSIVPPDAAGGGRCTLAASDTIEFTDAATGEESTAAWNAADPDVIAAQNALPNFMQSLPLCAIYNLSSLGVPYPDIQAVAIDLSGKVAALDVEVPGPANLDPNNECLPANFEGVPVEQEVVPTIEMF
jgi:hypothetical protein